MDEGDNYQDKRCQTYLVGHNTKIASKENNFQYKIKCNLYRLYRYLFIYLFISI